MDGIVVAFDPITNGFFYTVTEKLDQVVNGIVKGDSLYDILHFLSKDYVNSILDENKREMLKLMTNHNPIGYEMVDKRDEYYGDCFIYELKY